MISYTYGPGTASLEISKTNDNPPNFSQIVTLAQQDARNHGLGEVSVTPIALSRIGCPDDK